jgi:hypothetical protein
MSAFGGKADITATERNFNLRLPQKLRQLGDIHRDPSCLVFGEQFCRQSSSRLILEIGVGERLSVVIADDETGVGFLDVEAAGSGGARAKKY